MGENNYKQKRKILIIGAILLISFILFSTLMIKIIKENGKCANDPFKYAAGKLEDSGGEYDCSCNSLTLELLDFRFNAEDGIEIIKPNENYFNANNLTFPNIQVKGG